VLVRNEIACPDQRMAKRSFQVFMCDSVVVRGDEGRLVRADDAADAGAGSRGASGRRARGHYQMRGIIVSWAP